MRLSAFVLAFVAAGCSKEPSTPTLEFATVGFILHLPVAMQQALDEAAPAFRTVSPNKLRSDVAQAAAAAGGGLHAGFAIVADFDGDGSLDAIVEGAAPGDTVLHVIAIMNGPQPTAFEVTNFPVYDADAVGIYLSQPTGGSKGSFDVINFPDASTRYTYRKGRFAGTPTGN